MASDSESVVSPGFFCVDDDESGKLCLEDENHEDLLSLPNEHLIVENKIIAETAVPTASDACGASSSSRDGDCDVFEVFTEQIDREFLSGENDSRMIIEGGQDVQDDVGMTNGQDQEIGVPNPEIGVVDMEVGSLDIDSGVIVSRNASPKGIQETNQQDIIDDEDDKDENDPSGQIVYFVNNDAKITPSPVLQYVLDVDQAFDTIISCGDGKVGAHRLVLTAASPFIGSLFSSDHRLGEVAVIILPDIRVAIFKTLLNFCYTGSMMYPKEMEKEIFDAMRMLLMGEFGELTLKKVVLREELQPMSSSSNIFSEQQRASRTDRNNSRQSPMPSCSNKEPRIIIKEMSTSSSDEDEKETDPGEDSGNENDENCEPSTSLSMTFFKNIKIKAEADQNVKHVPPILSTFVSNSNREEAPYDYVIAPLPPGCKIKKWQCSRCPAAFKSTTTLDEHLENAHSVYTESRDLDKTEIQKLLNCGSCNSGKHDNIAATNQCLSKHKKTRCYACFESVYLKKFEQHMAQHGKKEKNGMCIVKCSWCDAGIAFLKPFDNKLMSAHCFSQHFANVNDPNSTKVEMSCSSAAAAGTSQKKPATVPSNFRASAPNVLEMLRQASLNQKKRKVVREIDFEVGGDIFRKIPKSKSGKATKKIRLEDEESKIKPNSNLAKRTGTRMGPLATFEQLSASAPDFKLLSRSTKTTGKQTESIWMNISKLPNVYVKLGYGKSYIMEQATSFGLLDKQLAMSGNEELKRDLSEEAEGENELTLDPPEITLDDSKEAEGENEQLQLNLHEMKEKENETEEFKPDPPEINVDDSKKDDEGDNDELQPDSPETKLDCLKEDESENEELERDPPEMSLDYSKKDEVVHEEVERDLPEVNLDCSKVENEEATRDSPKILSNFDCLEEDESKNEEAELDSPEISDGDVVDVFVTDESENEELTPDPPEINLNYSKADEGQIEELQRDSPEAYFDCLKENGGEVQSDSGSVAGSGNQD